MEEIKCTRGLQFIFPEIGEIKKLELPVNFLEINDCQEHNVAKAIKSMSDLYCKIWAEEPWNELDWEYSKVERDFIEQSQKKNFLAFMATNLQEMERPWIFWEHYHGDLNNIPSLIDVETLGFSWGYEISDEELKEISGNRRLVDYAKKETHPIFYIAELGVGKKYRKHGIGIMLSNLVLESAKKLGFKLIILRTDEKAYPAKRLYTYLGFKELPLRDAKYQGRTYWSKKI